MLADCNYPFSKFTSIKYFPKIKALLKKTISFSPTHFWLWWPRWPGLMSLAHLYFLRKREGTHCRFHFCFFSFFLKSSVKSFIMIINKSLTSFINHFPLPLLPAKILFPTDSNFKPIAWIFTTECEPIHWIQIHTNPRSRIAQHQQWLRSLSTLWSVESVQRFEP